MTDDERDELATAYLDDECTAEERRQVESDPGLRARVAEFAAVRAAVAGPVPASPPERREEIIAAALTEFGRVHGADAPASLTAARVARRSPPLWTRLAPLGAVAAVLVAIVGLAVALRDSGSDESDDDATTAAAELETSEESGTALAAEPPVETTRDVDADDQAEGARDEATTLSESAEATPETEAAGGEGAATTAAAAAETTAAPETTALEQGDGGDVPLDHVCDPAVREVDPELGELLEITDAEGGSGRVMLVYGLPADPEERRSYEVDPPACAEIVLVERP